MRSHVNGSRVTRHIVEALTVSDCDCDQCRTHTHTSTTTITFTSFDAWLCYCLHRLACRWSVGCDWLSFKETRGSLDVASLWQFVSNDRYCVDRSQMDDNNMRWMTVGCTPQMRSDANHFPDQKSGTCLPYDRHKYSSPHYRKLVPPKHTTLHLHSTTLPTHTYSHANTYAESSATSLAHVVCDVRVCVLMMSVYTGGSVHGRVY